MGAFYETIPESLIPWILAQPLFYVASAPLSGNGHVNVSPKGGSYFGVVSTTQFWYLDLTGSGVETISHLHEPGNGRITIMFNAFDGPPKIVRLWGKGRPLEYGSDEYEAFVETHQVKIIAGTRAVVVVDIHQVGSSCGFSVPKMDFKEHRLILNEFFEKKAACDEKGDRANGIERYWAFKNTYSMDGLPGMHRGLKNMKTDSVKPIKKMVGPLAELATKTNRSRTVQVPAWAISVIVLLSFVLGVFATVLFQDELGLRRGVWMES